MKKQILKKLENTAKLLPKSYEIVRYGSYVRHHQFVKMLENGMIKEISSLEDIQEGVKSLERWYDINIRYTYKTTENGWEIDFLPLKGNIEKEPIYHIREPKFKEIIHINRLKKAYVNSGASGVLIYIDWLDRNNKKMLELKEKHESLPEIVLVDMELFKDL